MHASVQQFLTRFLTLQRVEGKRVLEVGSYNVNGSPRDYITPLNPASYVGVDITPQEGFVDVVMDAENLVAQFGIASFDVVISTELFEHIKDWAAVAAAIDRVLCPGGLLLLTTRSAGFPLHGYPSDHWRYTTEDIGLMFHGYRAIYLGDDFDISHPGVFFLGVKKPGVLKLQPQPTPVEIPFHSGEACAERQRFREMNPRTPGPFKAFYHVACMGNWRQVFDDQVRQAESVGLDLEAHVIGTEEDFAYVETQVAAAFRHGQSLIQYETPTLQALYEWARENPDGAALYLHTKGVSQPQDRGKQAWRILMESEVLLKWRENLDKLATLDMVGLNWQDSRDLPHYSGNFWMARCDWLSSLPAPKDHRAAGGPWIAGNPWERMHAEIWLGCRNWHVQESLRMRNECLYIGTRVFELPTPEENRRLEEFTGRSLVTPDPRRGSLGAR